MYVHVNESRSHRKPTRVEHVRCICPIQPVDSSDLAGRDANINPLARRAAPVDYLSPGDENVEVHGL